MATSQRAALAAGAIVCTVCGQPFSLPEQLAELDAPASPVVVTEPG